MVSKSFSKPLGEYVSLQRGTTYKSRQLDTPGPWLLGLGSIARHGGFKGNKIRTYGGKSNEKILLYPGDLYVSLKDLTQAAELLGAVSRVPDYINKGRLTQDTVKLVLKTKNTPTNLIYWTLRTPQYRRFCKAYSTGTTNLGLSREDFLSYPIPDPNPLNTRIVEILELIENKIELNRRMNATLEGMAQALFKSWFVDFDPVLDNALAAGNPIPDALAERAETRRQALANGTANREAAKPFPATFHFTEDLGWIPAGWEPKKLSDLLEVKYGKDHKKLDDGNIPVYGSGGLMRHAEKSLYKGESVLIPRKGTLSNILYRNEEFWTVDTMFYTIPKLKFVPKYAFYHLKSLDFTSMNVGSAVPSMTTKVLNELPILMPTETILQDFDTILMSYFKKAEANDVQSNTLAKLRDTLLPKLISGELRIPDAEKLVAEALA